MYFWTKMLLNILKKLFVIVMSTVLVFGFVFKSVAFDIVIMNSVVSVIPNFNHDSKTNDASKRVRRVPEGSAVAILPDGFLVTNSHVLGNASKVDIRLNDGRLVSGKIVGRDQFTDIALLKVSKEFVVPTIALDPEIASPVCAIGNQFGLGLSVTCGVISATHRTGTGFNPIEDFIQTDASINPGGSGGALINDKGELLGIVSAIFTKNSDSNIGVNFATSIGMVLRVVKDLKRFGRVKRGKSGIRVFPLNREQRRKHRGAVIRYVKQNSAAEKGGLQPNDIIIKIGKRLIYRQTDVSSAFHKFYPGDKVLVEYVRRDKIEKTIIILLP